MTAPTGTTRTTRVLDPATLNRATLHRQLLLERASISAVEAVRHLVGLQAQEARAPYLGLWTRVADFHRDALTAAIHDRSVVRSSVLRGTQHLVTADDFRWLRPLTQPALDRAQRAAWGRILNGVDPADLAAEGGAILQGRTLTRPQLREALAQRWPGRHPDALAWSVQGLVPIVHPPGTGEWERSGPTPCTLAEEWIGAPLSATTEPESLIMRYLVAYGPASIRDIQAWSGVTRLAEVIDRLAPRLRTFADCDGAILYDLPDAPIPPPETPAPIRLLPEYDNLLLAFANRRRLMSDEHRRRVCVGAIVAPTFLIEGRVAGTWKTHRSSNGSTMTLHPFTPLARHHQEALIKEAELALAFAAPAAEVRVVELRQPGKEYVTSTAR